MINFVFNYFNIKDIRIDIYFKNILMIKILECLGFVYCGIVYVIIDMDVLRLVYYKYII